MHTRSQPQYEYLPSTDVSGCQGRPKFSITKSQLEYLERMSFNWTQIYKMLCVSRTTIYRRRVELSMDTSGYQRSNVTDDELECLLRVVKHLLLVKEWLWESWGLSPCNHSRLHHLY